MSLSLWIYSEEVAYKDKSSILVQLRADIPSSITFESVTNHCETDISPFECRCVVGAITGDGNNFLLTVAASHLTLHDAFD